MATRREFLAGAAGLCLASGFGRADDAAPRLMGAARVGGRDGGALWHPDALQGFALPARGHGLAHLPSGKMLLMGRRPGAFAAMIDAHDPGRPPTIFGPSKDCRFAGHAAVAPDGGLMVTSEFDAGNMDAVLAARDPENGAEHARWHPGGIEPHDLVFTKKGMRLVVALGGLIKDGGVAGPVVNPGGVKSEVLEIDPLSGAVLARHSLGGSLSLRHLALAPDGETVAVAAQNQDPSTSSSLVGLLRPGKGIEPLPLPEPREADFRGYVGSVAISGDFVAASSPRGGLVGLWSLRDRTWLGALAVVDVCGLAAGAAPGTFWASSGLGEILKIAGLGIEARWRTEAGFDNHLAVV